MTSLKKHWLCSLLAVSALFALTACDLFNQEKPPTTAPTSEVLETDTRPTIQGAFKLAEFSKLSSGEVKLIVVPYLTQKQQNDLFETAEIVQRLIDAPAESFETQTSTEEPPSAEDIQNGLTQKAREILNAAYQKLPNHYSKKMETEHYKPMFSFDTNREMVFKYRNFFTKIRPEMALHDVQKLSEWVYQESQQLSMIASRTIVKQEDIDFMGIGIEVKTQEEKRQDEEEAKKILQARLDLEWLKAMHKVLVETADKLGGHIQDEITTAAPSGEPRTPQEARAGMPPQEAWKDFSSTYGKALHEAFASEERFTPNPDNTFRVKGAGYVMVEMMILGQPAYFAEGVGGPVTITRAP